MAIPSYVLSGTRHSRTEEALAESQRRLEGIIVSAMDAIISIDSDQHVILFNPAAEKMFGLSAQEARGQDLFERGHPESEYEGTGIGLAIVRKAMKKLGGQVGFESEPGQGTRFWVQLPGAK